MGDRPLAKGRKVSSQLTPSNRNAMPASVPSHIVLVTIFASAALFAIALVSHVPAESALVSEDAQTMGADHKKVLANIVKLKSYAVVSQDAARKFKRKGSEDSNSVLAKFLVLFGNSKKTNPVTEYASIIGGLKKRYTTGVNRYLIDHLNKAILNPRGELLTIGKLRKGSEYGTYVFFNKNTLGLESQPLYFSTMAAKLSSYETVRVKYHENTKNAEAGAAAHWLKSNTKVHYKSFIEKVAAKYDTKLNKEELRIAGKALNGQRAAYKAAASAGQVKNGLVHPQPIEGYKAAKKAFEADKFLFPSKTTYAREAAVLANAWAKKVQPELTTVGVIKDTEATIDGNVKKLHNYNPKKAMQYEEDSLLQVGTENAVDDMLHHEFNAGEVGCDAVCPVGKCDDQAEIDTEACAQCKACLAVPRSHYDPAAEDGDTGSSNSNAQNKPAKPTDPCTLQDVAQGVNCGFHRAA